MPLRIDVWSDLACPWCYVGKRRLETALSTLTGAPVDVCFRSFELDPGAPQITPDGPYADRLAKKYGTTPDQAQQMIDRMTSIAAHDGLDFHFELARPGNTFDAHRLLHLARVHGVQHALKEALFKAYLTDGEPLGDTEVLARHATTAGLDPAEVAELLTGDRYASDVRADEEQARALGITGVPFFVIDGKYGISGAQPADVLARAIVQAQSERAA